MIDLSIVIVNWNVCELLRRCLHSILTAAYAKETPTSSAATWGLSLPQGVETDKAYRFEILVVDSASSDDSVDMVRQTYPGVRMYASETNLGYTGGNNLGIRESRGRYVLVLNPDTEVMGNALWRMLTYADAHSNVGVIGPQLLWPDGSVQASRRRFPSLRTALVESTFLQKWFPDHPALRRYYVRDRPVGETHEVDWVTGACMLVRREVIEQAGLLDDAFFMYSEELDWQRRIRAVGWQVVYLPAAQVVHHEGKSSEQVAAWRHIRFQRSKVRYFAKHHGRLAGEGVRMWLLVHYTYEWGVEALKWLLGHKRELRQERMRAYGQVLRSRLKTDH